MPVPQKEDARTMGERLALPMAEMERKPAFERKQASEIGLR
jgi:hypothetical protein